MTWFNKVINEVVEDEKNEKDDDYEIIMPDQGPNRLPFRPKEDAVPRVACEVSIHRVESGLPINNSTLSSAEIAFHVSRAMVVDFLSKLFPITERNEHKALLNDRIPKSTDTYEDVSSDVKNSIAQP
jgi:hypothetical protein